jgi:HAD superfamily hydrolase (TIGR01484 family)
MKRIIFCDIDSTLTKFAFKISKKNINAIKEYTKAGGDFVLTTGRSVVSTRKIQDQVNEAMQMKPKYIICSNGGYIVDNVNGDVYIYAIDQDVCWQLYKIIVKRGMIGLFYTDLSNDLRGVFATKT